MVLYIDNNKISYNSSKVVANEMKWIAEHFGKLTITRSDKFDFLGMTFHSNRKDRSIQKTFQTLFVHPDGQRQHSQNYHHVSADEAEMMVYKCLKSDYHQ